MKTSRIVEILQDRKSRGSGYLIAPRHVLTARHVPKPENIGAACTVRPLHRASEQALPLDPRARPPEAPAKVAWVSGEQDLACLEITGDPMPGLESGIIPFGRVPVDRAPAKCLGSGFPEAAGADQRTITGTLTWVLTGRPRFDIDVASALPRQWKKWAGFSGTAIFAGDLLLGVVRTVDENWGGVVLEATPVEYLLRDREFLEFLDGAGLPPPASRDVEAVDYAKAIYDRACGDAALPLDFGADVPDVSIDGMLRFSPRNPRVPFLGRRDELAALDAFLTADPPQPFAWWLMTGDGGAGKTRLARELCLSAHLRGWRAGFLPDGFKADIASLHAWLPQRPTLIVADYAMKRIAEIRMLAARLARCHHLSPLRLLLLERQEGELENQFLGFGQSDRGVIEAALYKPPSADEPSPPDKKSPSRVDKLSPLALGKLTDDQIWDLVKSCPWRTDGAHLPVTRGVFFERFGKLDSQRRALVAMILADALATSATRAGLGGLETELRYLLSRDRDLLWPAKLEVLRRPIGDTEADAAIAFATMVDGLHLRELKTINAKRGQPLSPKLLPLCSQAVGKPIKDGQLGRFEPDLIGEFFALETLAYAYADPPHDWMPETAWRVRGREMGSFVNRAKQNFPDHPSIARIDITVEGVEESWLYATLYSWLQSGPDHARHKLLEQSKSDLGAAKAFARLTLSFIADSNSWPVAAVLLDALSALQAAYPHEPSLPPQWEYSINFVAQLAAADPAGCRELLDALAALHEAHAVEPPLREAWARFITIFIVHRAAADPAGCRELLDALAALHEAHASEPTLREAWARNVTNFVVHRAAADPAGCRSLVNALAALHEAHAAEPALREQWANSVRHFVAQRAAEDPAGCRSLVDALAALHEAHAAEPALREQWANSVMNFIAHRAAEDPAGCRELLDALAALHEAHAAEPALRERWANSVMNFIAHRAA